MSNKKPPPKKIVDFSPEFVRDLSVQVYRARLAVESDVEGFERRTRAEGKDPDAIIRRRAECCDPMVRVVLEVLKSRGVDVLADG